MKLLLAALALASAVFAAPVDSLDTRQNSGACATLAPGDAPFSRSCSELASRIEYPRGAVGSKAGGVVFLVHGTGSQGSETWGSGPYLSLLPNRGLVITWPELTSRPGYDIAWYNSPSRSLEDAQVTAEFIAYNIKALAQRSKTGKVFVIGHSQGNINIQWALAFFPSVRQYVSGFASLAGDFKGTIEGPLLCTVQNIAQGGCAPSVLQQSTGSRYLAAANNAGGRALVNTLSLYTIYDEIIQPEVVNPTSELPGMNNVRVQDLCTAAYITDHFGMTVAAPAFYATLEFLTTGSFDRSRFNPLKSCTFLADSTYVLVLHPFIQAADQDSIPNPFVTVPSVIKQLALDAIAVVAYDRKVREEPKLMRYVCDKGAASTYCK